MFALRLFQGRLLLHLLHLCENRLIRVSIYAFYSEPLIDTNSNQDEYRCSLADHFIFSFCYDAER